MSVRNDGIDLPLGPDAQVQGQPVHGPLVLHVQRPDVGLGRPAGSEVVHFVVAVLAAVRDARHVAGERLVPPDVGVAAAGIRVVHLVRGPLVAEAGLEVVVAARAERLDVVDVHVPALGVVHLGLLDPRRVLEPDSTHQVRRNAVRQADGSRLVRDAALLRDAGVHVVVVEVAAPDAEQRGAGQREVGRARVAGLRALEAAGLLRLVRGERARDAVGREIAVRRQRPGGRRRGPQHREAGPQAVVGS